MKKNEVLNIKKKHSYTDQLINKIVFKYYNNNELSLNDTFKILFKTSVEYGNQFNPIKLKDLYIIDKINSKSINDIIFF